MAMTELNKLVSISKASYYENFGKKLYIQLIKLNPTGLFLKRFLVTINTIIWPLLINDKLVVDAKTKANIFNKYFAKQCTPLKNDSIPRPRLHSHEFSLVKIQDRLT